MARIFVSYSQTNRDFVDNFVPYLRNTYREHTVWYDENIIIGVNWWNTILDEIDKCDLFIYLISNKSITAPFCIAEFREAVRLQKIILPLLIQPSVDPRKAPKDIQKYLYETEYLNISGFFDNYAVVSAKLQESIDEQLEIAVTQDDLEPLSPHPTKQPIVNDNKLINRIRKLRWGQIIAVILTILVIPLFIEIVSALIQRGDLLNFEPQPAPEQPIEVVEATEEPTPTETDTPTIEPTPLPTIDSTGTALANQTETAINAPTVIYTHIATNTFSVTTTAPSLSSTPVTDISTQQQNSINSISVSNAKKLFEKLIFDMQSS